MVSLSIRSSFDWFLLGAWMFLCSNSCIVIRRSDWFDRSCVPAENWRSVAFFSSFWLFVGAFRSCEWRLGSSSFPSLSFPFECLLCCESACSRIVSSSIHRSISRSESRVFTHADKSNSNSFRVHSNSIRSVPSIPWALPLLTLPAKVSKRITNHC